METQPRRASVRLVISAPDRRVASAVLSRFTEWWDSIDRDELVLASDIEMRPDVTWQANAASVTLPVACVPAPPVFNRTGAASKGAELARGASTADHVPPFTFEIINLDDCATLLEQFSCEAASPIASPRWHRRRSPFSHLL